MKHIVTILALMLLLGVPAGAQVNGTMMQYFHWYLDSSDNLWLKVSSEAQNLADVGVTALWLPPAYKGVNGDDVGYGVYDLYDLGEFNQKGSIRTRYGYKSEYLAAVQAAQSAGMEVYADWAGRATRPGRSEADL